MVQTIPYKVTVCKACGDGKRKKRITIVSEKEQMFEKLVEKLKEKFEELKTCKMINICWKDNDEETFLIKDNEDLESAMESMHIAGPNTSKTTELNDDKTELNIWVTYEDENQKGKSKQVK